MKELELKHLAPYLPYDLSLKGGSPERIDYLTHQRIEMTLRGYLKPILRPLSDLIKIIEWKNSKYCVLDLWLSIEVSEENDFKLLCKAPEYYKETYEFIKRNPLRVDYGLIVILFEHHFDVFGLIEKGLAIDINTLEK